MRAGAAGEKFFKIFFDRADAFSMPFFATLFLHRGGVIAPFPHSKLGPEYRIVDRYSAAKYFMYRRVDIYRDNFLKNVLQTCIKAILILCHFNLLWSNVKKCRTMLITPLMLTIFRNNVKKT